MPSDLHSSVFSSVLAQNGVQNHVPSGVQNHLRSHVQNLGETRDRGGLVVPLIAPPVVGVIVGGLAGILAGMHPAAPSGAMYWGLAGAATGAMSGCATRWATSWVGATKIRSDVGNCLLAMAPSCILAASLGGVVGGAIDGSLGRLWLGAVYGVLIGFGVSMAILIGLSMLLKFGLRGHPALIGAASGVAAATALHIYQPFRQDDDFTVLGLRAAVGAIAGAAAGFACLLSMKTRDEGRTTLVSRFALVPLGFAVIVCGLLVGGLLSQSDLQSQVNFRGEIEAVDLAPDGARVVVSTRQNMGPSKSDKRETRVVELRSGVVISNLPENTAGLRFMPNGLQVVGDNHLWDIAKGTAGLQMPESKVMSWQSNFNGVGSTLVPATLDVGPMRPVTGGKFVLAGLNFDGTIDNGFVALWDTDRNEIISRLMGHEGKITKLNLSYDGKHAVSAADNHSICTWVVEPNGEEPLAPGAGKTIKLSPSDLYDTIESIAISPDGRTVVGSLFGDEKKGYAVRVWDVASGRMTRQIVGHVAKVTDVHFLKDGKRIVTGSEDGTVRMWELETGKELRRWHTQRKVEQVVLSEDGGRMLVAAGGMVKLFGIQ